jgi:hypothetical protein
VQIGGYQPLEKRLKDRKGRMLGFDDIQHYRRVVVALRETRRRLSEIAECLTEVVHYPASPLQIW